MLLPGGIAQDVASRNHFSHRSQDSGIVVEELPEVPTRVDHRFRGVPVPMDRHYGSGLYGVQNAPGKIFRAVPKDQVHPETLRRLRPGGQIIEDMPAENHGVVDNLLIR